MTRRIIKWTRQWGSPDKIIWVDVQKLNRAWALDRLYFGSVRDKKHKGTRAKYYRFPWWLQGFQGLVCMPHVAMTGQEISFTDGRHRFAWLRDHGVVALPVSTSPNQSFVLARRFGTKARVCVLNRKAFSDWVPWRKGYLNWSPQLEKTRRRPNRKLIYIK